MLKQILLVVAFIGFLNANDFQALEKKRADMSSFQHLNNKFSREEILSKYGGLTAKPNNDFVNDMVKSNYQGTDYLTKEEFQKVSKLVNKIKQEENKERDFILYFTSTSVPKTTLYRILFQVGILQENGFDIKTKQYLIGFPENFQSYLEGIQEDINNKPKFERKKIIKNSALKVDPRFFEYFELKKVPAMVLATCKGKNPDFKTCKFKFLLRGDTSLESFFDKIRIRNKKYNKYYEALLANKFNKKEDFDHEDK